MKPIIPNSKNPFKIDENKLKNLDNTILEFFPKAILSEGCKYGRWADLSVYTIEEIYIKTKNMGLKSDKYKAHDWFDSAINGKIFGKHKFILFFLPYFN